MSFLKKMKFKLYILYLKLYLKLYNIIKKIYIYEKKIL